MEELNLLESPQIKYIHFTGIGGISMSGLAEILLNLGYKISGSDLKGSNITKKLEEKGVKIYIGHSEENIENPDLLVYTAAVKDNNPELVEARRQGIPVIDRAVMLGQIMKRYPFSVAISGTHGKTTTTSMVTMIMLESGLDPTVHIGGELEAIGGNTRIGGNKYFITEACEYVESFLKFYPFLAVILNIEADHLDYYRDIYHIKDSFYKFASLVPQNGYVIGCANDLNTVEIMNMVSCNKVTYGVNSPDAAWSAKDIEFDGFGCPSFTLVNYGIDIVRIKLNIPGIHNVSNAVAAAAACITLGCSVEAVKQGLYNFRGTHRRFEIKGTVNDISIVDDYAHHPSEIKATLKAAKNCAHSKLWCVFQPHTYTRTRLLMDDFATAFSNADTVIVSDIYAAREIDDGKVHSSMLAEKIQHNGKDAVYIHGFDAIVEYLQKHASLGDLVITMGAGDIYKVGEMFLKGRE